MLPCLYIDMHFLSATFAYSYNVIKWKENTSVYTSRKSDQITHSLQSSTNHFSGTVWENEFTALTIHLTWPTSVKVSLH